MNEIKKMLNKNIGTRIRPASGLRPRQLPTRTKIKHRPHRKHRQIIPTDTPNSAIHAAFQLLFQHKARIVFVSVSLRRRGDTNGMRLSFGARCTAYGGSI
jgi:hypothetical protein